MTARHDGQVRRWPSRRSAVGRPGGKPQERRRSGSTTCRVPAQTARLSRSRTSSTRTASEAVATWWIFGDRLPCLSWRVTTYCLIRDPGCGGALVHGRSFRRPHVAVGVGRSAGPVAQTCWAAGDGSAPWHPRIHVVIHRFADRPTVHRCANRSSAGLSGGRRWSWLRTGCDRPHPDPRSPDASTSVSLDLFSRLFSRYAFGSTATRR